ncbi:MAG: hypothetical protein U5N55_08430 [Cypionkella sp.]|nr:hypothetical protein [Cypionkella sp.]
MARDLADEDISSDIDGTVIKTRWIKGQEYLEAVPDKYAASHQGKQLHGISSIYPPAPILIL